MAQNSLCTNTVQYCVFSTILYTRALGKTRDDIFEISKEMSPWYFGLAVFCLFEARVTKFDSATPPSMYSIHCMYTEHCVKFRASSLKLAEYIKPQTQRGHLFAYLRIPHLG
jgi:hypothetical protein